MMIVCYQVLKAIEKRPGMFTSEVSLKSIYIYILGYYQALLDNEIVAKRDDYESFFDWVAKKLGYFESTAGWVNIILAHCLGFKSDDIVWEEVFNYDISKEEHLNSIKKFYELLEEYKNEVDNQIKL